MEIRKRSGLLNLGMLVAGIGFTGWYSAHTVLDTGSSERVAHVVLTDETVRGFVAEKVEPVIAQASPAVAAALSAQSGTTGVAPPQVGAVDAAAAQSALSAVLANPTVQADLEHFIGEVHRRVIGEGSGPVSLAKSDVDALVVAAVPTISPDQLAAIPAVSFDVPHATPMNGLRRSIADWWWLIALAGVAMVATALVLSDDRRANVRTIGKWLIGLSLAQLVVLWLIPVHIIPAVTDNVWARVVSKVAEALNGGLVIGLFVVLGVGVVCLFVDLFLPDPARREPEATRG